MCHPPSAKVPKLIHEIASDNQVSGLCTHAHVLIACAAISLYSCVCARARMALPVDWQRQKLSFYLINMCSEVYW